jgi:hypothetical protein
VCFNETFYKEQPCAEPTEYNLSFLICVSFVNSLLCSDSFMGDMVPNKRRKVQDGSAQALSDITNGTHCSFIFAYHLSLEDFICIVDFYVFSMYNYIFQIPPDQLLRLDQMEQGSLHLLDPEDTFLSKISSGEMVRKIAQQAVRTMLLI